MNDYALDSMVQYLLAKIIHCLMFHQKGELHPSISTFDAFGNNTNLFPSKHTTQN